MQVPPLAGRPGRLVWSLPPLSAALVAACWVVMALAPALLPGATEGAEFASAISLTSTIMGTLIVARQPGNLVGWLLCVFGVSISVTMPMTALAAVEPPLPGREWVYWATPSASTPSTLPSPTGCTGAVPPPLLYRGGLGWPLILLAGCSAGTPAWRLPVPP